MFSVTVHSECIHANKAKAPIRRATMMSVEAIALCIVGNLINTIGKRSF